MAKKSTGAASEAQVATRDEIDQAIEALVPAQLVKLKKYAGWRIRGLGRASLGRDGDLLLQDALTSTIVGAEGSGEGCPCQKSHLYAFGGVEVSPVAQSH